MSSELPSQSAQTFTGALVVNHSEFKIKDFEDSQSTIVDDLFRRLLGAQ